MTYGATGHVSRFRNQSSAALMLLFALAALALQSGGSQAAAPLAVAVADFDYFDTSGEVTNQSKEHEARAGGGIRNQSIELPGCKRHRFDPWGVSFWITAGDTGTLIVSRCSRSPPELFSCNWRGIVPFQRESSHNHCIHAPLSKKT